MPAVSKAQSKKLNATFGHAWVKAHHFDNSTAGLPERVQPKKGKKMAHHKKHAGHHANKGKHTGKIGRHGMSAAGSHKGAAHASHAAMSKKHGASLDGRDHDMYGGHSKNEKHC